MMTLTKQRIAFWALVLLGAVAIYGGMMAFAMSARADTGAAEPPDGSVMMWIALGFAMLAGIETLFRGLSAITGIISKQTSNTVDDSIHGAVQKMSEEITEIRQVLTGAVQPPIVVVKPPAPGSGTSLLVVAVLLGAAALQPGCGASQRVAGAAKTAVIECGKHDAPAILAFAAQLGVMAALSAIGEGAIDWDKIEAAAIAQGKVTGGCALTRFVAELSKAKASEPETVARGLLPPPDPAADGAAVIARMSARFGGATWQLGAEVP